ncbi:alanine racemase [Corynebacterium pilosum]|uniref:Alanine racemase n=1 Tax=Corynebacterium pilosum TaxID=35756 RepID=A0A376CN99_9CORY|nr:alanine racemase [Corynebacterium pilosum]STC69687.1 alanine racemase [Corynebacterium pilosum]
MSLLSTRIDLSAIAHNTRVLKEMVAPAKLMCVVKADGYNHGNQQVVPVMEANGADRFGVATVAEARAVRELTDKPVLAWIWSLDDEVPADIQLGVPTLGHLRRLVDDPTERTVYLMVDTGMNRSGIDEQEWAEAFELAAGAHHLHVEGLMTHLACADDPADPFTDTQADTFRRAIAQGRETGLELPTNHLANSPATLSRPDLYFDQVRPGVALYGLEPIANTDHGLTPAMTWRAEVAAVKPIAAGEGTSYGLTWRAPEDGFTAVIPAGYADGVPRNWQDTIEVTISGKSYPQVGRVCMDQFVVWLGSEDPEVRVGDEAIIFGPGGMSATTLADRAGTINYEVVCRPAGRNQREYIQTTPKEA